MSAGVGKGGDAKTSNQGLDLDERAENGRNLGKAIPWTHLPFKKSARVGLAVNWVNI